MAIQVLDGFTGAVITVLMVLVITDLTTGTGRFNLAQGVLGAATAAAAAISTGATGLVVQQFGDFAGFMSMAIAILIGQKPSLKNMSINPAIFLCRKTVSESSSGFIKAKRS